MRTTAGCRHRLQSRCRDRSRSRKWTGFALHLLRVCLVPPQRRHRRRSLQRITLGVGRIRVHPTRHAGGRTHLRVGQTIKPTAFDYRGCATIRSLLLPFVCAGWEWCAKEEALQPPFFIVLLSLVLKALRSSGGWL